MNKQAAKTSEDYVIRVLDSPLQVDAAAWNTLLFAQSQPTPFMRHEFLSALHTNGCATTATGWTPAHPSIRTSWPDDAGRRSKASS